jgi:selenide,water dikinase
MPMGGRVVMALNICGFPHSLSPEIIAEILRGGAEKGRQAGAVFAGGHTTDDTEPKYGLAVMGLGHPRRFLTKAGAKPGDSLLLTKPLGTGIITAAAKGDGADPNHLAAALASMKKLNKQAADIILHSDVHACADISGFALLGHACEMAEKSGVQLRFNLGRIPFIDGAADYAEQWLFPGETCSNERYYAGHIEFAADVKNEMRQLLITPETSGGLLVAVPPDGVDAILKQFVDSDHPCWIVGEVAGGRRLQLYA